MRLWSVSTTVRNPERLRSFLRVLQLLEGQSFNITNQKKYQVLLIQNKYYFPSSIPEKFQAYYDNPEMEMPFQVAEEIFEHQNYKDPAMRGRQSANPLNKLGFSIARERGGSVIITELGKRFIADDYDIGYIFFKSLLKLQFPNPWSLDFSKKNGFDVQPLVATMRLISEVNRGGSDKQGLTQTEFSLFVPSLIDYRLVNSYADKISEYRKTNNKDKFIIDFAKEFYRTENPTVTQIKNFFEYGDNIMRYFRLTKYFRVTTDKFGSDWRVDLEPTRKTEIEQIVKEFSGQSVEFKTTQDYLNYISDISLPSIPSDEVDNLQNIARSLIGTIYSYAKENKQTLSKNEEKIVSTDFSTYSKKQLDDFIADLRTINLNVKERHVKINVMNDVCTIQNSIDNLKDYKTIKKYAPEKFEKMVADVLRIINDEIKIKPNYPVDDNGEPISHALGNQPDIECFYESYNAICEVTLDTSNFQWARESQPVMRHLRDFEVKFPEKNSYCLFISPKIHIDTIYHFWTSVKHGYNGPKQRIIPLTTAQIARLLEVLLALIQKKRRFTHTQLEELYKEILLKTNGVAGHSEWFSIIPHIIDEWVAKVIV